MTCPLLPSHTTRIITKLLQSSVLLFSSHLTETALPKVVNDILNHIEAVSDVALISSISVATRKVLLLESWFVILGYHLICYRCSTGICVGTYLVHVVCITDRSCHRQLWSRIPQLCRWYATMRRSSVNTWIQFQTFNSLMIFTSSVQQYWYWSNDLFLNLDKIGCYLLRYKPCPEETESAIVHLCCWVFRCIVVATEDTRCYDSSLSFDDDFNEVVRSCNYYLWSLH